MVRILRAFLMLLLAFFAVFLLLSVLRHRLRLKQEAQASSPPGKLVSSGGSRIHIYAEGSGEKTIVFLSGHGTAYPTLDFKPLWNRLSDTYRVVVVERPGYGWSDVTDAPRDLETILGETRDGLAAAGENGPFVLMPHSMAGLEALYWMQKYPEEVEAVVGLDALSPRAVDLLPELEKLPLHLMAASVRLGLFRWVPRLQLAEHFPLLQSDELVESEKEVYLQVFYRSGYSKNMIREVVHLVSNAEIVRAGDFPVEIPMLFLLSREQDRKVPGWIEAIEEDLSVIGNTQTEVLEAGHYLHYDRATSIAQRVKRLLETCLL